MEPFADLFESRTAALDAIEAGGRQIEEFRSPYVGPVDTGRMVFPALEVLPESSDDQGGNVWTHVIRLNCYFERQRDVDYRTQLDAAGRAAVAAVGELASLPRAGAFRSPVSTERPATPPTRRRVFAAPMSVSPRSGAYAGRGRR